MAGAYQAKTEFQRRNPVARPARASYSGAMALTMPRERMLDAMRSRDGSFDGRFITGVLTTGIYCLPSCPARKPHAENVRFFPSPRQAREAGLRPCKRCRPDDFYRGHDPDLERVEELAARMRRAPGSFAGGEELVAASGAGSSKLHQLFRRHFHDTPARLLTRARVEAARRLLLAGDLPVTEVALEVGFESLSAFNANFRRLTAMTPSEYRRLSGASSFELRLPSPYPLQRVLAHLGRDPESRTERVEGGGYAAGLWLDGVPARLEARFGSSSDRRSRVRCSLAASRPLPPGAAARAHGQLLRRLGLARDPAPFEAALAGDPRLAGLVDGRRGLGVPLLSQPFECLTWAITGQQVNLPFACIMLGRLVERAGTAVGEGLWAPPPAVAVAELEPEDLRRCRFSRQKIDYLLGAARQVAAGELDLEGLAAGSAVRARERLSAVRGLGPWTVGYLMMRGLGFADCLPVGDAGLIRALVRFFQLDERPSPAETVRLMEPFRPYRSFATFHLWQSLEGSP